jgi:hypothetical protein
MRPTPIAVTLLILTGGCGSTLYTGALKNERDAWTVVLTELRDGPNSYTHSNITYKPESGKRLLWVGLTLKNGETAPRRFNYEACELDLGSEGVIPGLVTYTVVMGNSVMDKEVEFAAGEEKKRYLAFPYPKDRLPTRFSCAGIPIALPKL